MSAITTPVSDEVKKIAFEKVVQIHIYQLHIMTQIIDLGMSRGAFRGNESSQIGTLYDILSGGINQAYRIAEEEIRKNNEINEIKLPSIKEEDLKMV